MLRQLIRLTIVSDYPQAAPFKAYVAYIITLKHLSYVYPSKKWKFIASQLIYFEEKIFCHLFNNHT